MRTGPKSKRKEKEESLIQAQELLRIHRLPVTADAEVQVVTDGAFQQRGVGNGADG